MERRPPAVTLISYLLMLIGFFGILGLFYYFYKHVDQTSFQDAYKANPLAVWEHFILPGVSLVVGIVTGKLMLEAVNWARITYTVWVVIELVAGYFTGLDHIQLLVALIIQTLAIFCLYLPGANKFFTTRFYGVWQ